MDGRYCLIDCPGSIEFAADADAALPAVDLALVVTDSDPAKAALVQPVLKELERLGVPRMLFVNKIDQARGRIRDLLAALQPMSAVPLVARQIPIWEGEKVGGFIDLDRKSTRLNSSHANISYAVFCLQKTAHRSSYLGPRRRRTAGNPPLRRRRASRINLRRRRRLHFARPLCG